MKIQPALLGNQPIFSKLLPIAKPVLPAFNEVEDELRAILGSGILSKGSYRAAFEAAVAEHLNVKHAIAVGSCTTGLMLTYQALGLGGTDVVVPSFTFMATVSALRWAGARPVFADVDLQTQNLDARAAESVLTANTSAIVAIHNSGNPADIAELEAIAARNGLHLIFDAAHAFGSAWNGEAIGPQGDAQVFSLTPTKLVVAGEGGIITTNNSQLADRVRITREYGNLGNYDSDVPGLNGRLPEISALLGHRSLLRLEPAARRRNELATYYRERLQHIPGIGFQLVRRGNRSSFKDFSITIDAAAFGLTRDELVVTLAAENIETRKYFDPPVHRQQAYRAFAPAEELLPNTNRLAEKILNLPIWSDTDDQVVSDVCLAIERAHEFRQSIREILTQDKIKERSLSAF